MPVPLPLGVPPRRDEHPVTARLLLPVFGSPSRVSPLVGALDAAIVYVARPVDAEAVKRLVAVGTVTGLDLTGGERSDGEFGRASADDVADFLAVLAHAETGFVARAGTADDVLAVLAATVAALRGDDVRAAWTQPDVGALAALRPGAAAAVREVLLGVEVADLAEVVAGLAVLDSATSGADTSQARTATPDDREGSPD